MLVTSNPKPNEETFDYLWIQKSWM